jgi:acetyl esterase/lipase
MKRLLFLSLCFLLVTACNKELPVEDPFDPSIAKEIKNESYGSAALQKADIYLPANRNTDTKTVILIHGGFWTSGDKTDMDTLLAPIKAANPALAIVNINYRLADGAAANQHRRR